LIKKVEFFAHLPNPCFTEEPIRALIETALKPFHQQTENLGIAISFDMEEAKLLVDKELVVKAFSMVMENSLDALTKGGAVSVRGETTDNEYRICLTDTGSGISPQDLPYIFNPFFSTKPDGAGIGLAVVKRIMENQGGSVELTSKPGKGATILLLLPLERRRSIRISPLEQSTQT
jgi:signal transduction histidine kinase